MLLPSGVKSMNLRFFWWRTRKLHQSYWKRTFGESGWKRTKKRHRRRLCAARCNLVTNSVFCQAPEPNWTQNNSKSPGNDLELSARFKRISRTKNSDFTNDGCTSHEKLFSDRQAWKTIFGPPSMKNYFRTAKLALDVQSIVYKAKVTDTCN